MTKQNVIAIYKEYSDAMLAEGRFLLKSTEKGFWGVSVLDDIYEAFDKLKLNKAKSFLDLGSGDGRVVLAAACFTNASGVEHDQELHDLAVSMRNKTNLSASFIKEDYLTHDLSKYDIVFINPDNNFEQLNAKLQNELNGKLIVYGNEYEPKGLKKEKEFRVNGIKLRVYS